MANPCDEIIESIRAARFHNHRLEEHSDIISNGIFRDLVARCPLVAEDLRAGRIANWKNVPAPGATRGRKIDLFVGEPGPNGTPDVKRVRIVVENKSVITAHRNKTNRLDDLSEVLDAVQRKKAEAITVATVLVGIATRVLNVPDQVKKHFAKHPERFNADVLSRLSSGDQTLWDEFDYAVSTNRADDAAATVKAFRSLPTRNPAHTHIVGYDFVLIVPVYIDNVNPPYLARENPFGIDIDAEYDRMLALICRAYEARWHF